MTDATIDSSLGPIARQVAEARRPEHEQKPRQRRLFWIGRLAGYPLVFGGAGLIAGLLGGTS